MNRSIFKNSKGTSLASLLSNDTVREYTVFSRDLNYEADLVDSVPNIDISRYLSSESKDVLKNAGSITLSYNANALGVTHLLQALISHEAVVEKLVPIYRSNLKLLHSIIPKHAEKGVGFNVFSKNNSVNLSEEVEFVLNNSLSEARDMGNTMLQPEHIFLALLKSGNTKVSRILWEADLELTDVSSNIENESHKNI
ncbi:MAG: Clp protease N-terminal domain-containing protein [Patescibacteria group bacterium]